MNKLEGAR